MIQNPIAPAGLEEGDLASLYAGASLVVLCIAMDEPCQEGQQLT